MSTTSETPGTSPVISGALTEPFLLHDPARAWRVEAGYVDLFLARYLPGGSTGARTHIARFDAGAVLFSFPAPTDQTSRVVLAQPSPEAQVIPAERDGLDHVGEAVEQWTVALTKAAWRDLEPKEYQPLNPGGSIQVRSIAIPPQPVAMTGSSPVVWVTHLEGQGTLLGDSGFALNGNATFPLARPAWILEQPGNILAVSSTEEIVASGTAWAGLDLFQTVIFRALVREQDDAERLEKERLAQRNEQDAVRFAHSIERLSTPLAPPDAGDSLPGPGHPLVRACQAIGSRQQIEFVPPPEVLRGLPVRDPVRAISRSTGVRARRVALEENWYRGEGYPLLAFRESDESPVALLPNGRRGYEIFDPVDGTKTKVTAEIAASLQPFAYTFYRPFHPKPVTLKYLLLFGLAGSWGETILVLALGLVGGALGMVMPIFTATVFDVIIPGAQRQRMLETALFLFAATIASAMLNLTRDFTFLRIENKVETKVQAAVFDRLLNLPAQFFRQYSSGELAQRASAIGAIRKALTGSAVSALFAGLFSVFNFFLLFYYSMQLAMLALVLTAIQLVVLIGVSLFFLRVQRRIIAAQVKASGLMLQLINGIAKFRVSGTERRAFAAWSQSASDIWVPMIQASRIGNRLGIFNAAFPLLALAAIYFLTGKLMAKPDFNLSTGSFMAFGAAYGTFTASLVQMTQVMIGLLAIIPHYQNAKPILEAIPEVDPAKPLAGDLTGKIELSHVCFRYRSDGPPILKDISLSISPGEFVAFVGPSGAGKSTVFRILLGFEKPESGTVFFDGQDIGTLDISSVRQQMGVVMQNSTVFAGDIFQNIVCSAPYTLDQAWEAARLAGFEKDLQQMPMGMHTIVGEGGAGLSGGQRQRLMIARAIVGKPRILLFDEATSALDNQTQATVSRSLEAMRSTRVVVAHRLSTVMNADRIFVIDRGELVQSGTYQELLNQPGPFAELAKRQLT